MKKISALIFCLIFAVSIFIFSGNSLAAQKKYVALGDSIAAGYGLSNAADAYPSIIAEDHSLSLLNLAVSGDTSANMLNIISNSPSIKNAALITISIGGNDLIGNRNIVISKALYDKFAPTLGRNATIALIKSITIEGYFDASGVNFDTIDADINRIYSELSSNLKTSINILRANNPDAIIIVHTLYNPYIGNPAYRILGNDVGELIAPFISRINATYSSVQSATGNAFTIVDVASGMNGNTSFFYDNWDFHPTKEGHAYIASTLSGAYSSLKPADTTATTATTATTKATTATTKATSATTKATSATTKATTATTKATTATTKATTATTKATTATTKATTATIASTTAITAPNTTETKATTSQSTVYSTADTSIASSAQTSDSEIAVINTDEMTGTTKSTSPSASGDGNNEGSSILSKQALISIAVAAGVVIVCISVLMMLKKRK
ncbi:MAG: SGNH/GDSL hydrolase family protein [Eubacteriales bacterium]